LSAFLPGTQAAASRVDEGGGMTDDRNDLDGQLISRRRALGLFGSFGVVALAACTGSDRNSSTGTSSSSSPSSATSGSVGSTTASTATAVCSEVPEETAGPFVVDLGDDQQIFRSDITEGREGVPLDVTMTLIDVARGCAPLAGARVDMWQCDKDGVYSAFSQADVDTAGETFLRGIQMSDDRGVVRFTTIYPGWYPGRATHIHFQVFVDGEVVATSQLAFPEDVTRAVYDTSLYAEKGQSTTSTADDGLFSDGVEEQLLALTGNVDDGYKGNITVGITV
jgi:protocatechuate 3,4-dioxygenase beta subunit